MKTKNNKPNNNGKAVVSKNGAVKKAAPKAAKKATKKAATKRTVLELFDHPVTAVARRLHAAGLKPLGVIAAIQSMVPKADAKAIRSCCRTGQKAVAKLAVAKLNKEQLAALKKAAAKAAAAAEKAAA